MLRDLLYFDLEKAASLAVQTGVSDAMRQADVGATSDPDPVAASLRVKARQHELLTRVEEALRVAGLVADLSDLPGDTSEMESIREAIGDRPFLAVHGRGTWEDFQRIGALARNAREIIDELNDGLLGVARQSAAYAELARELAEQEQAIEAAATSDEQADAKRRLSEARRSIDDALRPFPKVDEGRARAVSRLIDTFMATRLMLRLYPFSECPEFPVLCSLRRKCFVEGDPDEVIAGYGSEASVPLSVFGLITALPGPDHFALPWKEFLGHPTREESPSFDGLLREALPKRRSVEHILSLSRFPNVTIQPIAVYRSLQRRRRHPPEKLANE